MLKEGQVCVCVWRCGLRDTARRVIACVCVCMWVCVCIRWAWTASFDTASMCSGRVVTWAAGLCCLMMKNWRLPPKLSSSAYPPFSPSSPLCLRHLHTLPTVTHREHRVTLSHHGSVWVVLNSDEHPRSDGKTFSFFTMWRKEALFTILIPSTKLRWTTASFFFFNGKYHSWPVIHNPMGSKDKFCYMKYEMLLSSIFVIVL